MKRFSLLAILVFALYSGAILAASFHADHSNSEHMNCKLCQISFDSVEQTPVAKAITEVRDFGFIAEYSLLFAPSEIAFQTLGRAPPTFSL